MKEIFTVFKFFIAKHTRLFKWGGGLLSIVLSFYALCLHNTELGEAAIMRNVFTGEIKLDSNGWNLSVPWVQAAHIDLRPMRLCISTAGRGYSCKLARFVPEHHKEFVETEGFRYYWMANRISFNLGYDDEHRGFRDIMRGHAYGAKLYSFIEVLESYKHE